MIMIVLAYILLAPSIVRVPDMSPVIFALEAPLTEPLPEILPSTASWDAPPLPEWKLNDILQVRSYVVVCRRVDNTCDSARLLLLQKDGS